MAIETQECALRNIDAGGMKDIPVPFPVNRAADLIVTGANADGEETAFALDIDYTVTLAKDAAGFPASAAVHFPKALPAGTALSVRRWVPLTQGRHFTTGQGYFPEEMERALDLLTMIAQQLGHPIETAVTAVGEIRRALEEEAGARESEDDALGERLDRLGDIQKIMDAAETILGASGDLQGAVKTIYFTSDGVATAYSIPGPAAGRDIPLMAFDTDSRRRIYFAEKTEVDGSITLELAEALPEGERFGVVYLRAAGDEERAAELLRHIHTEAIPAATWVITHDIVKGYPRLFLLNDEGKVMVAGENWALASTGTLTLTFSEPVAGVAILTGYPADSEDGEVGRHVHEQDTAAATWVITHDIVKKYPRVFVLDAAGGRVFGQEDWSQASVAGTLTLTFSAPFAGVAILSL